MTLNEDNKQPKLIYKELSFKVNGLLFNVHNELGRYCREKQYGDVFENFLKASGLVYEREKPVGVEKIDNKRTNIVDFTVDNKIALEFKTKPLISKEDYYQIQRYLQASGLKLGLMVNFRNKYLRPIRIVRIDS